MNYRKAGFTTLGALSLALVPSVAYSLGTPANTEIRNQSTATYVDSATDPQVTTSNEVINLVAPVYGFAITPNASAGAPNAGWTSTAAHTQRTAAGNIAYFSYLLRNTSNAQDTFDFHAYYNLAANSGGAGNDDAIDPVEIKVYFDSNGNGQVDPGDILLETNDGVLANFNTSGVKTPQIAPDGVAAIIVAVQTPVTAASTDSIYVDIDAVSTGNAGTDAVSNMARVQFTADEGVLTITKGSSVASAQPGQVITFTIEGSNTGGSPIESLVLDGSAIPALDLLAEDTDFATGTVNGVLIIDDLDEDYLIVDSTPLFDATDDYSLISVSNVAPSTAQLMYWDEENSLWSTLNTVHHEGNPRVALFIPRRGALDDTVLDVGQSYRVSFTVQVTNDRAALAQLQEQRNGEIWNDSQGYYDDGTGDDTKADSNDVVVLVSRDPTTVVPGVKIGPLDDPEDTTGTGANRFLTSADHPRIDGLGLVTLSGDGDTTFAGDATASVTHATAAAATRYAGDVINYPLTVRNTGEATDTFAITISVNAGYTAQLFKSDGVTPLADTNGDGQIDTGPVAIDTNVNIVARIILPDNAESAAAINWTVTATSSFSTGNPAQRIDTTFLEVSAISPAGVDIAAHGEAAQDDNDTNADYVAGNADDTTVSVNPGSSAIVQVDVANMRPANQPANASDIETRKGDTYNLSYTAKTLGGTDVPFIVGLYEDAGDDGALGTSELLEISDTRELQAISRAGLAASAALAGADEAKLFNLGVRITIPEGTPAGTYYVNVTATSTNNSNKSDTMSIAVVVLPLRSIDILPDNSATVVPGGSVVFRHLVVNNGNVTEDVLLPAPGTATTGGVGPLPAGWTAVWVSCADGTVIGATQTINDLDPAETTEVCLRVFVPTSAAVGVTTPVLVQADGIGVISGIAAPESEAYDVITVISGNLVLTKVNEPTASTKIPPNGGIRYTTTYRNLGSASVSNVVVFDAIPVNVQVPFAGSGDVTVPGVGAISVADYSFISGTLPNGSSFNAHANKAMFEWSQNGGISYTSFVTNPTPGTRITHVRFLVGTVAPGESGTFTFTVRVD